MADPIKHVIVLMLENRSFDQMLGCYHPYVDGVDPVNPKANLDSKGKRYAQTAINATSFKFDPKHEWEHVVAQLKDHNSGFVLDFEAAYRGQATASDYQSVMNYFAKGEAPAIHQMAENYAVCDRWFSSVPGPTWANRFFVHSGTSKGRVKMGSLGSWDDIKLCAGYDQKTIYDHFERKAINWRIYAGDIPQSAVLMRLWPYYDHFRPVDCFYEHAARNEEDFPTFCFLEPRYYLPDQNDDHPPHNVTRAQEFIASVYNTIRANEELWLSTLLVVMYDEHGGFYDHVEPPRAVPPDNLACEGCNFDSLGVRVPVVLVSPWVDKQVFPSDKNIYFDHTSLLKFLCDKWGIAPWNPRIDNAPSFQSVLRPEAAGPRLETPKSIRMPKRDAETLASPHMMALPGSPVDVQNEHQEALMAFIQFKESESPRVETIIESKHSPALTASVPPLDPEWAKSSFRRWMANARR